MLMHRRERQAHLILEKQLPFYANLSSAYKAEFRKRVNRFIRSKTIRGGKGFKLSYEHIVSVAGSAIQVSFGNDRYLLSSFDTIIIYEKVYQHPITKNYHRGEVNPTAGIIVVSWEDFVYGYSTKEDNLNVGLHEMAHAYYFEIIKSRNDYVTDYDLLSKFMFVSEHEILKIRKNRSSLFRNYAGENVFEFFAVSVEYFFEDGNEFRQKLPKLYRQMCLLLNQDSADRMARGFDYSRYFEKSVIVNKRPPKSDIVASNRELDMTISVKRNNYNAMSIVLVLAAIIQISISNIVAFIILIGIIGLLKIVLMVIKYTSEVFTTQDHLYIIYRNILGNYTIGIPFKGIFSVSMRREYEGYYLINYNDNGELKHIKINTTDSGAMRIFEKCMISNSVMFKLDGMRMPRIKSHKETMANHRKN